MLMIIMISFIIIGAVTVNHFIKENEEYHEERLKRKEVSVIKSIGYFLENEGIYENPDSVVVLFSDKICELADINSLDINIFNLKGELLISSHSDYFEKGIFVFQLPDKILNGLKSGEGRMVVEENLDSLTILSTYRYMENPDAKPIAIINLPYFQDDDVSKAEIREFLITLTEVYLLLFLGAAIVSYFLSNYITGSIETIGTKLKQISLHKRNEPLEWNSNDEIGTLVREYNRMLTELEKSAELLAKSERESAWREMAKQVAHEIKNPLTSLRSAVETAAKVKSKKDRDQRKNHDEPAEDALEFVGKEGMKHRGQRAAQQHDQCRGPLLGDDRGLPGPARSRRTVAAAAAPASPRACSGGPASATCARSRAA